jgi:hypothetical protein
MRAIGIGIPFMRRRSGAAIDAQAQAHYNRVIADGGLVPSGLSGVNAFFKTAKTIYGTSDINSAISAAYDPQVLGYKLGAGSGTTLGQAAQKLYSPKGIFGDIGTGSAFWEGVGVVGNNVTTSAIVSPTNQLDVVSYVYASTGHTNAATIISNDGNARNFVFNCQTVSTGILQLRAGTPFTNFNSTTGVGNFDNYTGWIRATYNQNGINGDVTFYTSTDNPNTPINSITWIQLGSVVSSASTGLQTGTHSIQIGSNQGSNNFTGRIGIAAFSTLIGGSPSVLFNANQYTGANTWTSTTSEVWTVNSTGAGLADVVQTTAASQPLLLTHTSGSNYWFGSGVAGNNVTTPNAAANQITGDIDIIVNCSKDNWSANSFQGLISKDAATRGYVFYVDSANNLALNVNVGGSLVGQNSSVALSGANQSNKWLRATRSASTGNINYYTSLDPISTNPQSVTWTQLGTANRTSTAGSIVAGTARVDIGAFGTGDYVIQGKIYRATISNSIGGVPVVDFNPNQYNPSTSQTQWTSSTGEVWSISTGTATTGYKGHLCTKTIIQGDGINSFLSGFDVSNLPNNYSLYGANRLYTLTGAGNVFGASAGGDQFFHFYINSNTFIKRWSTGPEKDFGTTLNLLTYTGTGTGAGSVETMERNNAGIVTVSNARPIKNSGVAVAVFASSATGNFKSNTTVNTLIITKSIDNSTVKTSMYNYIRSINNNAF